MHYLIKIITLFTLFTTPLLSYVGTVTALRGDVHIKNSSVNIAATLGAQLNEKDHIITADKSKAQLIFKDNTIVTVGKNSNFSIASYLYDDKHEPTVEFGLLHGAIRTITGKIGKIAPDKFKVKTKNVTIGIRGTNFTVVAGSHGSTQAYCTYGAIRVTFRNKAYTIQQGYYVNIMHEGRVEVKTFSAAELKNISKKSFEEKESSNSSSDKEAIDEDATHEVNVDSGLDVTVEDVSEETQQDLGQGTQDAAQTDKETQDTTDTTQTDNQPHYLSISGASIDDDSMTSLKSDATLRFTTDGSIFDSKESWVEVKEKYNGNAGQDNWRFYLASTPTQFSTKDNFQTTFSSLLLTPGLDSSSHNAELTSGKLSAFADLSDGDYMSWGDWSATVSYHVTESESGTDTVKNLTMQGLWIAGEETSPDAVNALVGSSISYIGEYKAIDFSNTTPKPLTGEASMLVDFGNNQATLTIGYENGDATGQTQFDNMQIEGNSMSGVQSNGPGSANGVFYGPKGESIGGNFSTNTPDSISMVGVKGVYQVQKQLQ